MPEHVGIQIPNGTTSETAAYTVIVLLPLEYQETSPPTPTDDNVIYYSTKTVKTENPSSPWSCLKWFCDVSINSSR